MKGGKITDTVEFLIALPFGLWSALTIDARNADGYPFAEIFFCSLFKKFPGLPLVCQCIIVTIITVLIGALLYKITAGFL